LNDTLLEVHSIRLYFPKKKLAFHCAQDAVGGKRRKFVVELFRLLPDLPVMEDAGVQQGQRKYRVGNQIVKSRRSNQCSLPWARPVKMNMPAPEGIVVDGEEGSQSGSGMAERRFLECLNDVSEEIAGQNPPRNGGCCSNSDRGKIPGPRRKEMPIGGMKPFTAKIDPDCSPCAPELPNIRSCRGRLKRTHGGQKPADPEQEREDLKGILGDVQFPHAVETGNLREAEK